jgi:hypothetical protein
MGRRGIALICVSLFSMLGGATESAVKRAGTGARVMPFPTSVVLDNFGFPREQAWVGGGPKQAELAWERRFCDFCEVDKPARRRSVYVPCTVGCFVDRGRDEASRFSDLSGHSFRV